MMVSGITGISGMNSYRISSIHGNPYTLNPVSEITEQTEQSGRPLVIAADKKDELYVKDYGELKIQEVLQPAILRKCLESGRICRQVEHNRYSSNKTHQRPTIMI